jgi:hypothetical protein
MTQDSVDGQVRAVVGKKPVGIGKRDHVAPKSVDA